MQLNGTSWRGGTLRVEPSHPDYQQRLTDEAAAEVAAAQQEDAPSDNDASSDDLALPFLHAAPPPEPLRIRRRGGGRVRVPAQGPTGAQRKLFPPACAMPLADWVAPEDSVGAHGSLFVQRSNAVWDAARVTANAAPVPLVPPIIPVVRTHSACTCSSLARPARSLSVCFICKPSVRPKPLCQRYV